LGSSLNGIQKRRGQVERIGFHWAFSGKGRWIGL
jgi:hypothetical protein